MQPPEQSSHPVNDSVQYEERDIRFKPLVLLASSLLVLLLLIAAGIGGLFGFLAGRTDRRPPRFANGQPQDRTRELQQVRQRQRRQLDSFGWVSREQGIVRIPIERAMQLKLNEAKATKPKAPRGERP